MTIKERIDDFTSFVTNFVSVINKEAKLDKLILQNKEFMDYLTDGGFFTAPASTKYHGAYEGGLYDHSKAVTKRLIMLTVKLDLEWQRVESPFIVGMFHDLCKCDQYVKKEPGLGLGYEEPQYEYNENMLLKGHGDKSVMLLSRFMTLTEEEILCIRYHMGAYEQDDWKGFDAAIKKFPTVLFCHLADQLASKVDGL